MRLLAALAAGLAAAGLWAYWALVLSEGVYLGPRVVIWLYDRVAERYDQIKNLDPGDDAHFLARPLLIALDQVQEPCVLDVGTGTGRLPMALLAEGDFCGQVLGVDRSAGMLAESRRKLSRQHAAGLVRTEAGHLPFAGATFDAVTCLETLEFTQRPQETLRELVRVLKPGGILLTSNRVGRDALWFPGRPCRRGRVEALLRALGMQAVEREPWQVHYDLVWGVKGQA